MFENNMTDQFSFCSLNWGNGRRDKFPFYEGCDDGNNLSYDGWSLNWEIEENYVCNQNETGTDIWTSVFKNPKILSLSFDDSKLEIVIEFDQTMKSQKITSFDMILDISGQNSPYSLTWTTNFDINKLVINFSSSPNIFGNMNEIIFLQLKNVQAFKSEQGLSIMTPFTFEFIVDSISATQLSKSTSSGVSYSFAFTLLLSIAVSLFTGGSIDEMWSLANTIQVIFFYWKLKLYFPPDLLEVFSNLKFSNFDNPFFEFLRDKSLRIFDLLNFSRPTSFNILGLSFVSVLVNFWDKLIAIFIMISFIALFAILNIWMRQKTNKIASFIKKKDFELRYEGISRLFIEIMLNMSFYCFINIIYGSLNNFFNAISYIIAILLLVANLYVMIYWFIYPYFNYYDIWIYPEKHERHWLLFLSFNKEKIKNLLFYGYFTFHRIAFSFIVVWMNNFWINQWIIILMLHVWISINTFWPFKRALFNFLHTFNWIIQCILGLLLFLFIDSHKVNRIKISGYVSFIPYIIINIKFLLF